MADVTTRSTGNRRAVRNALFRSMMDRRKLRESDLRPSRTVLGPPRYDDTACEPSSLISPEYLAACRALTTTPEPHPWVRLWRRLVWGA